MALLDISGHVSEKLLFPLLNNAKPVHQYELWASIFYIITDIESIDILIKGSEY